MAKVQQKSEKISAFGGIFFVLDKFDRSSQRYLGMTAPMTQVPVPTATVIGLPIGSTKNLHDLRRYNNLRNVKMQY